MSGSLSGFPAARLTVLLCWLLTPAFLRAAPDGKPADSAKASETRKAASPATDASDAVAAADPTTPPTLTEETVAARLKIWGSAGADSAVRKTAVPMAEEAASLLQQAAQSQAQGAAFQQLTKNLPERAAEIRAGADRTAALPENLQPPPPGTAVDVLEVAATRLHAAVEDARRASAAARDLPQQNASRRRELSASVTSLGNRLLQLRTEAPPAPASEPPEITEARSMAHQAGLLSVQTQLDAAQAELSWLDAADAVSWPSLSLAAATRLQTTLEKEETALVQRIAGARAETAASGVETATRNEASAPAELRPVLEQVTQHANENREVVENLIPAADALWRETEGQARKWLETALRTREKIRRLGATGVVGVELRQQRQNLPSPAALQLENARRQDKLNGVELRRLGLEEEIAALPTPVPGADLSQPAAKAAQARHEGLTTLLQSYDRYYSSLVRLEESAQQLQAVVRAHREFIHENILWIPSSAPAGRESVHSLGASLRWMVTGFFDPQLLTAWWRGVAATPVLSFMALIAVVVLFVFRNIGRRRLCSLARLAAQSGASFRYTAAACLWTVVMALPWASLMWLVALPWQDSLASSPFALALAASLQRAAVVLLGLELTAQPLRGSGLAVAHFHWPPEVVRRLRWQFRHMGAVVLPAVLLASVFRLSDEPRHDPAERGFLVLQLAASAWWVHRFWKLGRDQAGLPARGLMRLAWRAMRALSLLIPLTLAAMALRGYLYTADVLTERLAATLLAAAAFLLGRALFYRWYALHRRNLRAERARRLREAREAARTASAAAAATSVNTPAGAGTSELPLEAPITEITGSDIDEAGQEMRGLVDIISFIVAACALWVIWADVLPAAKTLANRPLDSLASLLSDTNPVPAPASPSASGSAAAKPPASSGNGTTAASSAANGLAGLSPTAILTSTSNSAAATSDGNRSRTTWLGVIMAMSITVLTFLAARRMPGALQFLLTTQLSLDAGARFALSTITRYVITIVGVVLALAQLGITWSSVQWLAAALTVGLGFGLQEIFANFFSGLILLAERPIRPGDLVTIDNITGSVSRIQIRATTIRAADGKDYIVPNKELITGKLLNWTRTDTVTRQEISVLVPYGTNPTAALKLLAQIAADHPAVLRDPAPVVSFESFGESVLRLFLRFHVATLEQRLPTLTDLNCAIANNFAAAHIGLPLRENEVPVRTNTVIAQGP